MDQSIITAIILGIFGLALGSFAGASVWRLRAAQLKADIESGEKVSARDKRQIAKLSNRPPHTDRSVCLHCGHTLAWYDLVPLVSWLTLGGKCRYCKKRIGWYEPVMELGLAAFFVVSYAFWPAGFDSWVAITQFGIWLIAGVGMAILFAYDAKWYLLPNVIVFPLIGLGVINAAIVIASNNFELSVINSVLFGCVILSGLYYVIYIFSRHRWVGFGDIKLTLALALLLSDWQLAIIALFLANLIGTIIFLPFMVTGKLDRQAHVPFGPLLIIGGGISGLFGHEILSWYLGITLGL